MPKRVCVLGLLAFTTPIFAQTTEFFPPDNEIQTAIDAGIKSTTRDLSKRIYKRRSLTITRGWPPGDTVTKRVVFITDLDRVMLIAADHKRRLQPFTVADAKQGVSFGTVDVQLESSANGVYQGNVSKWAAPEVHMVLKSGAQTIQPRSEDGKITTPPYGISLYSSTSATTSFTFTRPTADFTVVVISGDGHSKEKPARLEILK